MPLEIAIILWVLQIVHFAKQLLKIVYIRHERQQTLGAHVAGVGSKTAQLTQYNLL